MLSACDLSKIRVTVRNYSSVANNTATRTCILTYIKR